MSSALKMGVVVTVGVADDPHGVPFMVLKRFPPVQPGMMMPVIASPLVGVCVVVMGADEVMVTTLVSVEGGVTMTGAGAGALPPPPPPPPDEPPPEPPPPPPPPPEAGAATETLADWVAVSQVKVKLAAEPMELMVSEPVSPLVPLQPPDAVQVLALVEDQVRTVEPPEVMEVGLAEMVAVAVGVAGGAVTAMVMDWVAVPHVRV